MKITSLTNAKVKQWSKYKRKEITWEIDKKFLIEGEHLLQEAHKEGLIECVISVEENTSWDMYEHYEITSDIMKKLSSMFLEAILWHYVITQNKKKRMERKLSY